MTRDGDVIYMDYNATTPVAPQVLAEMMPYFSREYGNASSAHAYGTAASEAVELARRRLAMLLGCQSEEVIFTGGGSESNNLAIKGVVDRHRTAGRHVITSAIEHPSVQNTCGYLRARGDVDVTVVSADRLGRVDPEEVVRALKPETVLVTIMLANNEVGTIQDLHEVARGVHAWAPKVVVHTDAAQAVGKIPVDATELEVDLLTVAGHKLYGPKGVGALFVRHGVELVPLVHGSGHERGCRSGTLNVPGIVGLGMAAEVARCGIGTEKLRLRTLRDRLQAGLCQAVPSTVVQGHPEKRLPNTLNIAFPPANGGEVLALCPGIAASTGSACHSRSSKPSDALLAMGVPRSVAAGALRLSIGRFTTEDQVDSTIGQIAEAVLQLQDRALIAGAK